MSLKIGLVFQQSHLILSEGRVIDLKLFADSQFPVLNAWIFQKVHLSVYLLSQQQVRS